MGIKKDVFHIVGKTPRSTKIKRKAKGLDKVLQQRFSTIARMPSGPDDSHPLAVGYNQKLTHDFN